jgi:phage recombination protein Bet
MYLWKKEGEMSEELAKYDMEPVSLADVKKYIAPKATDKELFMFMGISKAYGLNPLKREIHFIKYGDSAANIVVGYETYLKRAEKTGKLDGWEVKTDGKTATISIRRKDWKEPFVWTVERSEFDKGQANWKTMPNFMLKKVAIAQGFRLAFPSEMGGMPYIPEEIGSHNSETLPAQAEVVKEPVPSPLPEEKDVPDFPANEFEKMAPPPNLKKDEQPLDFVAPGKPNETPATPAQKRLIWVRMKESGISQEEIEQFLGKPMKHLNKGQDVEDVLEFLARQKGGGDAIDGSAQ